MYILGFCTFCIILHNIVRVDLIIFPLCYILLAIHEVEKKGGVAAGTTGGGGSSGEGATGESSSPGKSVREREREKEREKERCVG